MPRFEILEGKHEENGKTYRKGETFKSTVDLAKIFPNRFRPVGLPAPVVEPEDEEEAPKPRKPKITIGTPGKKADAKAEAPKAARGTDVSDAFETAEGDIKVFQRGDLFHVFEGDETTPLNKKGLPKDEVNGFITSHLEE